MEEKEKEEKKKKKKEKEEKPPVRFFTLRRISIVRNTKDIPTDLSHDIPTIPSKQDLLRRPSQFRSREGRRTRDDELSKESSIKRREGETATISSPSR
uniref:Uncharacterized protein n=1 Tax=Vespula pensylvanica TaxID=30213 RepID=A0A834JM02_VESPE|nr:hypothetical protein H0235_017769 [Vespula pensylvanica]